MAKAPFRLLAIVNRLDLRKTDDGDFHAGEGRFVFGLVDVESGCMPREFVVIFEYGQPAATVAEIQDWAHAWHGLSAHGFGPDYNESLEAVTHGFTGPGADPSKPNGSSINQIRTNEIVLDGPWELREFRVEARRFRERCGRIPKGCCPSATPTSYLPRRLPRRRGPNATDSARSRRSTMRSSCACSPAAR